MSDYSLVYNFNGWAVNDKDENTLMQFGQGYDSEDGRAGAVAVLENLEAGISYDFNPCDSKHLGSWEDQDSIDLGAEV